MDRDEEHLAKQFDALVAQLPRQPRRRRLRALPWIVGMGLAIAVLVTLRYTTRPDAATGRAVTYPLAVCGNGLLEPSEDCELSEPGCPADCVRLYALDGVRPRSDARPALRGGRGLDSTHETRATPDRFEC